MPNVHLYLSLFPTEALIASHLDPAAFSVYMATGTRRGASEPLTFLEVTGDISAVVSAEALEAELSELPEGRIKHSLYLSVYRSLELLPLDSLGPLYLTTPDGKALQLASAPLPESPPAGNHFLYQELCPVRPLVVSKLNPAAFGAHMTDPSVRIHLPKIAFVHKQTVTPSEWGRDGFYSGQYLASPSHVQNCFTALDQRPDKLTKVIGRSRLQTFSYGLIDTGIYIAEHGRALYYPMKSKETLNRDHYGWAKSAKIF